MLCRIIDANLNRLREGVRVIEDIARYALNDKNLSKRLKHIRHITRINNKHLLESRDIKNDVSKQSIESEIKRNNLKDVAIANFKRAEESARVLEELLKIDSSDLHSNIQFIDSVDSAVFKHIRYELYDIEIEYFRLMDSIK
ncbi:thiamine-phosphate pyrophosphorylase [Helicobacter sp. 16-1353]|uniref:thiamine-phosphate pyrophosphorylase n=1 Tax=Helicobacter sp. 16-1353 TaxID=2004996 RepID=UPI00215CCFF6|nr:thiamine-phosphate pyrophosphorylase [Helicobacter sp. 16-1353]